MSHTCFEEIHPSTCGGGVVFEREVGIGLAAISPFFGFRPRCGICDVTVASGSVWWLSHGVSTLSPRSAVLSASSLVITPGP